MKKIILVISVFIFFGSSYANAENGHVDLKFLSEYVGSVNSTQDSISTQNLSGFGVAFYKKLIKESDGEKYVSYIEKSNREKKIEKKLYNERNKGTEPKTIAKLENMLFIEREKRKKLIAKRNRLEADPNWGGSADSKFGVGIIMGYKYLDGSLIINGGDTTSVEKNYAEIGIRINW